MNLSFLVYTKSHTVVNTSCLFLWTTHYKVGIFSLRYCKLYWLLLSAKGLYFLKGHQKWGLGIGV